MLLRIGVASQMLQLMVQREHKLNRKTITMKMKEGLVAGNPGPRRWVLGTVIVTFVCACSTFSATLEGQYLFNGNLSSSVGGAPSLTSVDPLGQNGFVTDTVDGQTRQVFHWSGNATPPSQQAGLSLDTSGLVAGNNYSVRMVFDMTDRSGAWRRVLDVQNRGSDDGFYVDPGNVLDVYPVTGAGPTFNNNTYEDVVLTDGGGIVSAYLNGSLAFSQATSVMDISNPGNLMNFFLDNTAGSGIGEFSNGNVAYIGLYSGVLDASTVQALNGAPLPSSPVPDSGATVSFLLALLALVGWSRVQGRLAFAGTRAE